MGKDRSPSHVRRTRFQFPVWLMFATLLLIAHGLAQSNDQARPTAQYKLSGSVVNAVTGEPVRRALVQVQGEFERSVLTDSSGHFEFNGLPAAHVNVTARKPGFFADEELDSNSAPPTSGVLIGPDTPSITVRLTPESIIYGKVEAPDGEPIEDIPVRVISSQVVDGRKRWEPRANGTTNEDGEFRVANLPPGVYYVEAGPGASFRVRRARRLNIGEEGYTTAFYPGATDPTAAAPIILAPGQQQEVQFSLKPQPVFKISGIVRGYQPEMGVNIEFVDKIGEQLALPLQFDPQTGRFNTKIPAGDYTLRARAQDAREVAAADLPISVTGDVSGVQVILGPGASIPIVVQKEGQNVEAPRSLRNEIPVAVHLFSSSSPLSANDFWSAPDPQGHTIAIRNVEPGKYFVEVTTESTWYVQSVTSGSTDLLRDELVVPAGSQIPAIEVVLRNDGATLRGTVQFDGSPEQGTAILVPDRGSAAQAKVAPASQSGEFTFRQLAPGDYRLLAFDRVSDLEYRDPEVLNSYLSRGVHVSVQANRQSNTSVELIKVQK